MLKLDCKGFTMIEVLAVIVIIAIIVGIAVPNVTQTVNSSKNSAENTMIENIITASQDLYSEIEFMDSELYDYGSNGIKGERLVINNHNGLRFHLHALIVNGFLSGVGDDDEKKLINPKTGQNLGDCYITLIKCDDGDYAFKYPNGQGTGCPNLGDRTSCS